MGLHQFALTTVALGSGIVVHVVSEKHRREMEYHDMIIQHA